MAEAVEHDHHLSSQLYLHVFAVRSRDRSCRANALRVGPKTSYEENKWTLVPLSREQVMTGFSMCRRNRPHQYVQLRRVHPSCATRTWSSTCMCCLPFLRVRLGSDEQLVQRLFRERIGRVGRVEKPGTFGVAIASAEREVKVRLCPPLASTVHTRQARPRSEECSLPRAFRHHRLHSRTSRVNDYGSSLT